MGNYRARGIDIEVTGSDNKDEMLIRKKGEDDWTPIHAANLISRLFTDNDPVIPVLLRAGMHEGIFPDSYNIILIKTIEDKIKSSLKVLDCIEPKESLTEMTIKTFNQAKQLKARLRLLLEDLEEK